MSGDQLDLDEGAYWHRQFEITVQALAEAAAEVRRLRALLEAEDAS